MDNLQVRKTVTFIGTPGFMERIKLSTCVFSLFCLSPATRHEGAWGDGRYRSYSFLISAPDGGEWSASRSGRALPPVPIGKEAEWAPEPVWTQRLEEKSSVSVGDRTPVVQAVVRHCTV
jgi:hypothetical protein